MTNEELNTELYKKLFAEQEKFKGLVALTPPINKTTGLSEKDSPVAAFVV